MKELTDKAMAKALGWKWSPCKLCEAKKRHTDCGGGCWIDHRGMTNDVRGITWKAEDYLPKWTTSLDAIVAEIEARGLSWHCGKGSVASTAYVNAGGVISPEFTGEGKTAPLALCHALLAYLKESPNAK